MSNSSLDRPEKPTSEQAGLKGERVWRTPRLVAAEVVAVTEKDPFTLETTFGAPS